jgi:hypothetical protein
MTTNELLAWAVKHLDDPRNEILFSESDYETMEEAKAFLAAPAAAPAGPGVRSACENLVAAVGAAKNDHGEDKDVWDKLDTACDAAQLALDQEPDGAELVKALQGVLDFYCPNRCGFEDHTPQCVAARAALAKWKGGVK